MTNDEGNPKAEIRNPRFTNVALQAFRILNFVILSSFGIRHSSLLRKP